MKIIMFVTILIAILIIIYFAFYFFWSIKDNKKMIDSYELELTHHNQKIMELEKRISFLEKDGSKNGKRDINKNNSSNRITK